MKLRTAVIAGLAAFLVGIPVALGLATGDGSDEPDSFSEAQQAYDPTNEPETVINQKDDGSYEVVEVSMIESRLPDDFPTLEEAGVKSLADEHEYIKRLDAYFEDHPQALQEPQQGSR